MKRLTCWLVTAVLALGVVAASAAPAWADEGEKPEGKKHEKKVRLDQVPAAAREAILKEAGKNTIKEIEEETENGRTLYEAEWEVEGKETEVTVTPDGKIVAREVELTLKEVPRAVRRTIRKEAAGSKVKEVEAETRNGRTVYEAEWREGDKEIEIKVAPDGKLLAREVEEDDDDDADDNGDDDDDDGEKDVTLDQVPAAVKATILKEAAGSKVEEIEAETRGGRTVYEAEWHEGGKEIEIKVAPDGKLLKREVEDDDDDD